MATGVGVTALRRRPDPLAVPLAVTMFTVAAWAIPHAVSFGYTTVEQVAFWHRLRYPGTVLAPVAYLVLALRYAGYDAWLTRRTYAALLVVPITTIVVVWTNPIHGLFWRSLSIARVGGASVLVEEFGPWYWVNLGYLYLVTTAAILVLGAVTVRSGPLYRKQAAVMFVGGLVPLATNAAVNFAVDPDVMADLTTAALAVSGVIIATALYQLDLLEIHPVARDRLLDDLEDGVVSLGPEGCIRDYNPTAARVLEEVAIGRSVEEVFPSNVALDGDSFVAETGKGRRRFRTRTTVVSDARDRDVGRVVYLNDVTDLVDREQRISVLNRVLRHNVRNELNVVYGCLEALEERRSPVASGETVDRAKRSTQRLLEFAEKARAVERASRGNDAPEVVSSTAVVERVLAGARAEHPEANIEYAPAVEDGADGAVRVVDADLFEMAVAELVDNAARHSDRESPRVVVRVAPDGDRIELTVADDGPGLPEQERAILRSRTETQLEHGSGLGLWLVKWTASMSSGTLSFAANDPRGSIVRLSLPAAE